MMIITFMLKWK